MFEEVDWMSSGLDCIKRIFALILSGFVSTFVFIILLFVVIRFDEVLGSDLVSLVILGISFSGIISVLSWVALIFLAFRWIEGEVGNVGI